MNRVEWGKWTWKKWSSEGHWHVLATDCLEKVCGHSMHLRWHHAANIVLHYRVVSQRLNTSHLIISLQRRPAVRVVNEWCELYGKITAACTCTIWLIATRVVRESRRWPDWADVLTVGCYTGVGHSCSQLTLWESNKSGNCGSYPCFYIACSVGGYTRSPMFPDVGYHRKLLLFFRLDINWPVKLSDVKSAELYNLHVLEIDRLNS
jgi:hypothetical protein